MKSPCFVKLNSGRPRSRIKQEQGAVRRQPMPITNFRLVTALDGSIDLERGERLNTRLAKKGGARRQAKTEATAWPAAPALH